MAAPFDLATLEITGDPVLVLQGVRQTNPGHIDFALSDEGTLVYVPDTGQANILVWVDREGQEEVLAAEPRYYEDPRISPDGLHLAITVRETTGGNLWIYDLKDETLTRLTFDPGLDHWPLWTPDGQRVVFDSTRNGANHNLFWKAVDGTGQVERLTTSPDAQGAYSFSPDGKSLVISNAGLSRDVYVLSMEGERTSQPLLYSEPTEQHAVLSPNGRWIAYESNESGRIEVYVRPFPNVQEGKWQISSEGGTEPVWEPSGRELFYRTGDAMMVVKIQAEPTFAAGSAAVLFEGNYYTASTGRQYDVAPDGQRVLMIRQEQGGSGQINVVLNWFEELKRLVPTP
jgi:serine/threonine-protein kinase